MYRVFIVRAKIWGVYKSTLHLHHHAKNIQPPQKNGNVISNYR